MPVSRWFQDVSIARKLFLLAGIGIAGLLVQAVIGAAAQREALMRGKEATTRHIVESAITIISHYQQMASDGGLTEEEAKDQAKGALRSIRFGQNDYVWINDMTPTMIMHPFKPELEGQNIGGLTDPSGLHLFQVMVERVKSDGSGFVHYAWPRPGEVEPAAKISYVAEFEPWGWIVGTGIYTDDVSREFHASLAAAAFILVLLALLSGGAALLVSRGIARRLHDAVVLAEAVASGRLEVTTSAGSRDEVGQLSGALQKMVAQVNAVLTAQRTLAEQHSHGAIDFRIDPSAFQGAFRDLSTQSNQLVDDHIQVQNLMAEIVGEYAEGQFQREMPELEGQRVRYTEAARTVRRNLLGISKDIQHLSQSAARGDFSVRGDPSGFRFAYREMVEQLNLLMEQADAGLGDVGAVVNALAHGDLRKRVERHHQGAFGRLSADVNQANERLTEIISKIRGSVGTLNSAASEIAAGNADLSSRTEAQAASLEETASSMEEMTSTVKQNAEATHRARAVSQEAADVAKEGGALVEQVVANMTAIASSAHRITDIIGIIDGIAFQTNILALNAAVEAARAGEQGRGFAVVATEVRSLAQRSAEAAREIKALIQSSVHQIAEGRARVNETGQAMATIVQRVADVSAGMAAIALASDEQSAGIEQINRAVTHMDEGTQQNAALVEEAAAAAKAMAEQANELEQLVSHFRC